MINSAQQVVQDCCTRVLIGELPADALLEYLLEDHNIYQKQSRASIIAMRGWILETFARTDLPESASVFVFEELQSGIDPYTTAAAARVLQNAKTSTASVHFLLNAWQNMKTRDDVVSFDKFGIYVENGVKTTARMEILKALQSLGNYAAEALPFLQSMRLVNKELQVQRKKTIEAIQSKPQPKNNCCSMAKNKPLQVPIDQLPATQDVRELEVQDHAGEAMLFGDFLARKNTIVVFFYSRCDNPHKCIATMARLANLQRRKESKFFQTAAITYDPEYDTPARLMAYANSQNLKLSDGHRIFRTSGGQEELDRSFSLAISRNDTIVNRHNVEAFVFNTAIDVVFSKKRLQWDEEEILKAALAG